jgi:hypothetical protein
MFKNQKFVLWIAVTLILLGGTVYYFNNIRIPGLSSQLELQIRQKVDVAAMPKRKVAVVSDKEGIARYTQLTDDIINNKIKLIDVPVDFTVDNAAIDLDLIKNKVTKEDLRYGEQIVMDSLSTEQKWFGDFDRLKEFAVRSIVAEEVKAGNIVDLLVNYRNGTYDVIVPKTKVRKVYKTENRETNTSSYTLIFALDETAYRDVLLAGKLGYLETRLYIDESQKASPKTFNYSVQSQKIPLIKVDDKDMEVFNAVPINTPPNNADNQPQNAPVSVPSAAPTSNSQLKLVR